MTLIEQCIAYTYLDNALSDEERERAKQQLHELQADADRWRGFRSACAQENEAWLKAASEIMERPGRITSEQIDAAADQANAAVGWPTPT